MALKHPNALQSRADELAVAPLFGLEAGAIEFQTGWTPCFL